MSPGTCLSTSSAVPALASGVFSTVVTIAPSLSFATGR